MARTAGATTERLLRAPADVFGARGYDGTRVSDIAFAAGLSNVPAVAPPIGAVT